MIEVPGGNVSVRWDHVAEKPRTLIVLAPGAGGTLDTPPLRDVCTLLSERGHATLRFNFLYCEQGRKTPDRAPKLLECWGAVADYARSRFNVPLFLGGRSMGGRMASNLVAEGYQAAGLILLAYPLHPPGKPERLRDQHLPNITVPMLWIQGTRDSFATPSLLENTVNRLPLVQLERIENADHSLRVPGKKPAEVNEVLTSLINDFVVGSGTDGSD